LNGGGSLSFMDNQKTASSFFTSQFMRAFIGCFSLFSLVAISWGTWLLIRKGHNQQLLLFLFPVFLFSMFIVKHVVASKHFLYYIPFFAIPVAYTFNRVKTNLSRKDVIPLGILIFTFLMQYVLGVRISLPSHPYTNESYVSVRPDPLIFTLGTIKTPLKYIDSVTFVVGGGTKLSTSDEMLLSSGILFSPVMWYNLKHESNLEYDGISQFLDSVDADTVHITTSQGGVYPIKNLLYLNGFTLRNPESKLYKWGLDYSYTWQKPDKVVIVDQATYPKDNFEEYISKMNGHKYKNFIHVAFFDWERWYVNQYSQPHKKISSVAYLFTNPQPKLEESSQALTVK
jgi:hypothetical protein